MTTTTIDTPTAFEKSTLDNGLRIVTSEMPHTRSVSISIFVGVGSRYESEDEAGISHFIEHLVFKGTPNHPDIPSELTEHGTRPNGTTSFDRTNYFETFPAGDENLEWALDLEADRMVNSFIAKAEVGDWPLFGLLAKLQRTVFIERRATRAAAQRVEEMTISGSPSPVRSVAATMSTSSSTVFAKLRAEENRRWCSSALSNSQTSPGAGALPEAGSVTSSANSSAPSPSRSANTQRRPSTAGSAHASTSSGRHASRPAAPSARYCATRLPPANRLSGRGGGVTEAARGGVVAAVVGDASVGVAALAPSAVGDGATDATSTPLPPSPQALISAAATRAATSAASRDRRVRRQVP